MERIVNKTSNYKDAEEYDIMQQISMTPEERLLAARKLQERFYGRNVPDVRDVRESYNENSRQYKGCPLRYKRKRK